MPGRSPSDFRWTAASPIFVSVPFGILSVLSWASSGPRTVFRFVGASGLLFLSGLCIGLCFRPRRVAPNAATPANGLRKALPIDFSSLNRVVTIDLTNGSSGLNLSRTFMAIAVAALLVVLSLITKQLQRGGSITPLGWTLSAAFVLLPVGLLRILRGQVRQLQFTPRGVKAISVHGSSAWNIRSEQVQAVSILELSTGEQAELIITHEGRQSGFSLSNHALVQLRRTFECVPQPSSSERGQTHVVRAELASTSLSQTEA